MNKRKILGTIIGLIFWSFCVVFFTYAYYDWKSNPTNVVLGIEDLNVECLVGADVNATNIGPVLNYQDGVKAEFSIDNSMTDNMAIELYLDITSISDVNLLTESLKYILVADSTGDTNYDYNNPVRTGDFSNFNVGNNLITQDLEVTADVTTNYQLIIYIDGNMYNNPNMQENSLIANLLVGNCDEDAVQYDDLVYQAIYSETDNSLTFVHTTPLAVGDTYNDKAVTTVYTGFETANYLTSSDVPWYSVRENITSVIFDSVIKPKSTARWFYEFSNLTDIDLTKLDTSNVNNMIGMFVGCESLTELDLSHFDTSNVTNMWGVFYNCTGLTNLDVSKFNTSKVTSMSYMFRNCNSLISLDVSNFNTSNVTTMECMFMYLGEKISTLDLSNWDTSNVTNMQYMFNSCYLTSLDLSGFETDNVEKMTSMFYGDVYLEEINISGWNTSNVTDMSGMFAHCLQLETIVGLEDLDTSNVTSMGEYSETGNLHKGMFDACYKLIGTITISNPNTTYLNIFSHTAINSGAQLTVNYTPETSSLVDAMIASKTSDANVVKGVCVGDGCPATDEGTV